MKSNTTAIFATPFHSVNAGLGTGLKPLRQYILDNQGPELENLDRPQGAHKSVFESNFDFFNRSSTEVQNLKNLLYGHMMNYLRDVCGFSKKELGSLNFRQESWYHITYQGGYFQPHTHPRASVSMIYCVDPGCDNLEEYEQGRVLFIDPRHNASMYLDPANRKMQRLFSFDGLRIRLSADQLCIFPSYLQHSVEVYGGQTPRITVAANFSF